MNIFLIPFIWCDVVGCCESDVMLRAMSLSYKSLVWKAPPEALKCPFESPPRTLLKFTPRPSLPQSATSLHPLIIFYAIKFNQHRFAFNRKRCIRAHLQAQASFNKVDSALPDEAEICCDNIISITTALHLLETMKD